MAKLVVLTNHERQVLEATIDRYLEIEQEAREATRDDPTTDSGELAETLDEYHDRKVALTRIRDKIKLPPPPEPYNPFDCTWEGEIR